MSKLQDLLVFYREPSIPKAALFSWHWPLALLGRALQCLFPRLENIKGAREVSGFKILLPSPNFCCGHEWCNTKLINSPTLTSGKSKNSRFCFGFLAFPYSISVQNKGLNPAETINPQGLDAIVFNAHIKVSHISCRWNHRWNLTN